MQNQFTFCTPWKDRHEVIKICHQEVPDFMGTNPTPLRMVAMFSRRTQSACAWKSTETIWTTMPFTQKSADNGQTCGVRRQLTPQSAGSLNRSYVSPFSHRNMNRILELNPSWGDPPDGWQDVPQDLRHCSTMSSFSVCVLVYSIPISNERTLSYVLKLQCFKKEQQQNDNNWSQRS